MNCSQMTGEAKGTFIREHKWLTLLPVTTVQWRCPLGHEQYDAITLQLVQMDHSIFANL